MHFVFIASRPLRNTSRLYSKNLVLPYHTSMISTSSCFCFGHTIQDLRNSDAD